MSNTECWTYWDKERKGGRMFFYSVVYEGGTRLLGQDKPLNKWLSFVSENQIDLSLKEYSPKGYLVKAFGLDLFQEGAVYDVALGGPPIIVHRVILVSREGKQLFPEWLKNRLEQKEFRGEKWWIFKSKTTGLLFVRINQPNFLGRTVGVIKPAFPVE